MKTKVFLMSILVFTISGCEFFTDHVYSIKIQNNSGDTIQYYASFDYPDTSIVLEKPRLKIAYPNDYSYLDSDKKWDDALPQDTLIIYILSMDTVSTYDWEYIANNNNILRRYILSIDDIERQNNLVVYP